MASAQFLDPYAKIGILCIFSLVPPDARVRELIHYHIKFDSQWRWFSGGVVLSYSARPNDIVMTTLIGVILARSIVQVRPVTVSDAWNQYPP